MLNEKKCMSCNKETNNKCIKCKIPICKNCVDNGFCPRCANQYLLPGSRR